MDFAFTPEEDAFRSELRAFLAQELPAWWRGMFVDDDRVMPLTREICAKLAERGWLTMAWPEEHGGQGASTWMQTVLREEMWAHEEPRGPQYMNLNYIGPLLMRFGTPDQRAQLLPLMAAGKVIFTQLFSEPDAGSDLASLHTRARDEGDHFVVNGQKIWSSYADAPADWGLLLARTDPDAPKHAGISVFLLDMTTPGVTVRPIPTMAGPHEFNEVFLDDVVVPRAQLLGVQNQGWDVITTGLTFERTGIARYARAAAVLELGVAYANETGRSRDPDVRRLLADLAARIEAARLCSYRAISIQARGEVPTVEASIARMHNTVVEQLAGNVVMEVIGPAAQLRAADPDAPFGGEATRHWLRNIPTTVAAGTLEVQKNIVAQRGLGLPRPG
ncbi:MAG: acyl-CoA dehydrogenase family protein [Acidimicrobiia bacterium]|jgi:alkylation response protein AidB-like acyl-CoA dehydrogenase